MRNNCLKIRILETESDKVKVKFIESDIVMHIPKAILQAKVRAGFYNVVKPASQTLVS